MTDGLEWQSKIIPQAEFEKKRKKCFIAYSGDEAFF